MITRITSPRLPHALGPYAHATILNGVVYVSGQIGLDPQTNIMRETLEEQTIQVLKNLTLILEDSGSSMQDVAKITIYLADIKSFGIVNKLYEEFIGSNYPARATVAVADIPAGALIEMDAIAGLKK